MTTLETALKLRELRHRPIPVKTNSKQPFGKAWQHRNWREDQLREHFGRYPNANIGVLLGPESGLVDLEFDGPESETVFRKLFPNLPPTVGYESNRSEHNLFGWNPILEGCPNVVLLNANGEAATKNEPHAECRIGGGDGCQSLLPPSIVKGDVRDRHYIRDWSHPLVMLPDEIAQMIKAAAKPKQAPVPFKPARTAGDRPGDDFNKLATWEEILVPAGWKDEGSNGEVHYWKRPGKLDQGSSATTGHCKSGDGDDKFYCFSSKAPPFEPEKSYSKFACYALLHHAGDFSEATKALAKLGYGAPTLWQPEGRTDSANSKRFARKFGNSIRWCDQWDKWLVWDGRRWAVDKTRAIDALAKKYAHGLWTDIGNIISTGEIDDKFRRELIAFGKSSNSNSGIYNFSALSRSESGIPIVPEQLDTDQYLLNVKNGTLDLRTGKLLPHERAHFITKVAPVEYKENAQCPEFLKFLSEIFNGDAELIGFIQRLFGYCLTGDVMEEVLPIFYGTGANGKTTLLNIALKILGDYGGKAAPEFLTARKMSSHPTELCDLHGRRMVVASETEQGAGFAEAKVKELTGAERIKGRRMREDFWEFDPTHKLIVQTNYRPNVRGNDPAIWRRLLSVPFNVTIPKAKQDHTLPDKLEAEMSGILNWMLVGCLEWRRDGLKVPEVVRQATEEYKQNEDVFTRFIDQCCMEQHDATISAQEILEAYREFSGDGKTMSAKKFNGLLTNKGFKNQQIKSGPQRGRMEWIGLALAV
jgi:P4 family phage/plasmid primase-like protien